MRHKSQFTCLLCAKVSTNVIVTSAPAEVPDSPPAIPEKQIQLHPPKASQAHPPYPESIPSLFELSEITSIIPALNPGLEFGYEHEIDSRYRLTMAQLLKDIKYPEYQLPDDAKIIITTSICEGVARKALRHDLLETLVSLLIDSGLNSSLADKLVRCTCSPETESLGKRLVDEGYGRRALKKKISRYEKRQYWCDDSVRMQQLHTDRDFVKIRFQKC
jgi:hypothetical protein